MIITQTPFRMSFFGGGTDMESFFKENGGAVLSTTFDKYCYVNVRHGVMSNVRFDELELMLIQFIQALLEANGLAAGKDHQFKGRYNAEKNAVIISLEKDEREC